MFPSKNIFESNEINRLFSHTIENDAEFHYLFQSPIANRSSSSADSVSPENYFDIPFQYPFDITIGRSRVTTSPNSTMSPFNDSLESPTERNFTLTTSPKPFRLSQIIESPRSFNQRPIVGRKILGASQAKKEEIDRFYDWTPPSSQPRSYELFPKTKDHINNKKTFLLNQIIPTISPTFIPRPPSVTSNYSNTRSNSNSAHNNFRVPESMSQFGGQICTFCRKNGERPAVYENHCVKEKIGGKYIVTCPILRSHRCQECGVTGDDAHTITYCPVLRSSNNGRPLVSTTVKLKSTPIKSNGKRRYSGQNARM